MRCTRGLVRLSEGVEHGISVGCTWVASKVARFPKRTLGLGCLFIALLSLGWLAFEDEDNPEKLYAPQDTKAFRDRDWIEDRFPDSPSPSTVFIDASGSEDMFSRESIRDMFRLYDYVMEIEAFGGEYGYDQRYCEIVNWASSNECQKEGILALWNWNSTLFEADDDILGTINRAESIEDCCAPGSRTVTVESIASKIKRDENGLITKAGSVRLSFYLINDINSKSREDRVTVRLENKFDDRLRNDFDNSPLWDRLKPITPAGVGENVGDAFDQDQIFINLSFVLILAYAYLCLYKYNSPTRSRGTLGLLATLTVLLSVAGAFGIALACGVIFSPTATIAVYLVLGIGLDDAFVICGAEDSLGMWEEDVASVKAGAETAEDVATRRVVAAMVAAGPSITITSITDFFAFVAGSYTRIPAIRAFCSFSASAVLCDYIMQITFFVAFLTLDLRGKLRKAARGDNSCCCCGGCCHCCKSKNALPEDNDEEVATPAIEEEPAVSEMVLNKTGDKQHATKKVPRYNVENAEENFFGGPYARALLSPLGMSLVTLCTMGLTVVAAIGCARFTMDFNFDWFIVGGYVEKNLDYARKYYSSSETTPVGLYTKRGDYYAERDSMDTMIADYEDESYVKESSVRPNWWTAHWDWASESNRTIDSLESFGYSVQAFLEDEEGSGYSPNVIIDADGDYPVVVAAAIDSQWFMGGKGKDAMDEVEDMQDARGVVRDAASPLDPIVYTPDFVWTEGFAIVVAETLTSIGIACATVAVVLIILLGDLRAAVLVSFTVVLTCLCTIGSIYWYNDHLNSISAFFIIIAVGLSSDAPAHVCHAFQTARGTRRERAAKALNELGPSVFKGQTSTIFGIAILGFAVTYVFQVFFRYLMTILVLAIYFGLVQMPVALALVGPAERELDESPAARVAEEPVKIVDEEEKNENYAFSKKEEGEDVNGVVVASANEDDPHQAIA